MGVECRWGVAELGSECLEKVEGGEGEGESDSLTALRPEGGSLEDPDGEAAGHGDQLVAGEGASEHERPATGAACGAYGVAIAEAVPIGAPSIGGEGEAAMAADKAAPVEGGCDPEGGGGEGERRGERGVSPRKAADGGGGQAEGEPGEEEAGKRQGDGAMAAGPETERGSDAEHGEDKGKHHGGDHENPVGQLARKRRRPVGAVGAVRPGAGENKRPGQGGERPAPPIRV